MNKSNWVQVTRDEFLTFINNYPRPYKKTWNMVVFPEILQFYEPTEDGSIPQSFALQTYDFKDRSKYQDRYDLFYIRKDLIKEGD